MNLRGRIIKEVEWLLKNDWYSERFNQVSGLMVYGRLYKVKRLWKVERSSKRWRNFVKLFGSIFDEEELGVDEWGYPIILHHAKEQLEKSKAK